MALCINFDCSGEHNIPSVSLSICSRASAVCQWDSRKGLRMLCRNAKYSEDLLSVLTWTCKSSNNYTSLNYPWQVDWSMQISSDLLVFITTHMQHDICWLIILIRVQNRAWQPTTTKTAGRWLRVWIILQQEGNGKGSSRLPTYTLTTGTLSTSQLTRESMVSPRAVLTPTHG